MSEDGEADLAVLAIDLFAIDPIGLGGIVLRSAPGRHRDRVLAHARAQMSSASPSFKDFQTIPSHVTEDRLLGGIALAETLQTGRLVRDRGLLEQANGGVAVLSMAERLPVPTTASLLAALDHGSEDARCGLIALDESRADEDRPPPTLRDRLAFDITLTFERGNEVAALRPIHPHTRTLASRVAIGEDVIGALCKTAIALGVTSLRAPILAARAARAHAALHERERVTEEDAAIAARLVLGPRATMHPSPLPHPEPPTSRPDEEDRSPRDDDDDDDDADQTSSTSGAAMDDLVLAAAESAVPAGLLSRIGRGRHARSSVGHDNANMRGGCRARFASRTLKTTSHAGRPVGTRSARDLSRERLNLVATLRAAAPWQPYRRRFRDSTQRVLIEKGDLGVSLFQPCRESTVLFCVDSSGSAALQRLAEAKGAVEQLLHDCYVRRDHVALIAFRGSSADVLLPPTRSLTRARRRLADLPAGGTTPLAAGIEAALRLATDEDKRRGRTPLIVFMTDGRANVSRHANHDPHQDALAAARSLRAAGISTLFLDTSPRARKRAEEVAITMGAHYLPLPFVDPIGLSRQIRQQMVAP